MSGWWIHSKDKDDADFLSSVGVTLGERRGEYWRNCVIPQSAEDEMNEHWGVEMTWGEEVDSIVRGVWAGKPQTRIKCLECGCVIREDGSCSYPLCKPRALERKARLRVGR